MQVESFPTPHLAEPSAETDAPPVPSFTVAVLGDKGVGKTALLKRVEALWSIPTGVTTAEESRASTSLGSCTNYQFRKFQTARSLLHQSRFLRPNTHFSAFFETYKIHQPLHRSKFKICRFFAFFS